MNSYKALNFVTIGHFKHCAPLPTADFVYGRPLLKKNLTLAMSLAPSSSQIESIYTPKLEIPQPT